MVNILSNYNGEAKKDCWKLEFYPKLLCKEIRQHRKP